MSYKITGEMFKKSLVNKGDVSRIVKLIEKAAKELAGYIKEILLK